MSLTCLLNIGRHNIVRNCHNQFSYAGDWLLAFVLVLRMLSIEVVFLLTQALPSTAQFAQDQVSPLDPMSDSVPEQVLLLPGLQISVDAIEVTDCQVIGGVGVTPL